MSDVRIRTADRRLRKLLGPAAAALALPLCLALGAAAVQAQDASGEPGPEAAAGIDGTWVVDTSMTGFEEDLRSGSWVGFRVAEVLNPGGAVDAIGRTPLVSGQLEATGSVIENAVIEADLTGIVSDRPRREDAIQRSLGTSEFPTASFVSTAPVDLGSVPADNEPFSATVPGEMTIRDVTQAVELELMGQRVGDLVVVVGTLPVDFTSYRVTMPTAPIVVSVEGSGDLEWQLFLRREAEPATAADEGGAATVDEAVDTAADAPTASPGGEG